MYLQQLFANLFVTRYDNHMLYIITDGNHFKFGTSRNVHGRLQTLQTGNPRKLSIVAEISDEWIELAFGTEKECESMFHALLADYRIVGEWFKGTVSVRAIVDLVKDGNYDWILMLICAHMRATVKPEGEDRLNTSTDWARYFYLRRVSS